MSAPDRGRSADWDVGRASERTVLSWERTAISTLAVAALVLRAGIVQHQLALGIPVTVLLVAAAVTEWLFGHRIYREHERPVDEGAVPHDRAITAVGAVTLFAAAASVALAFGA